MKNILLGLFFLFALSFSAQAQLIDASVKPAPPVTLFGNTHAPQTVYLDGKLFEFDLQLIDVNQIESIEVVKGERAIRDYQQEGGVILIRSKLAKELVEKEEAKLVVKMDNANLPNIVIQNGVQFPINVLEEIDPDAIESIEVIKGKEAVSKYNATNGVIIIQLKEKK